MPEGPISFISFMGWLIAIGFTMSAALRLALRYCEISSLFEDEIDDMERK